MDFRIDDDRATLIEGVRAYLTDAVDAQNLRALDTDGGEASATLWQGLVEMGLPGLLVPEAQGGLGLTLIDAALAAIEFGRVALPGPIIDTALVAAVLLAKAGGQDDLLAKLALGEASVALQHPANPWVADAAEATYLLASGGDAVRLVTAQPGHKLATIDPLRRLTSPVAATDGAVIAQSDDLLDHAALITAAQLQGLGEAMLAIATEYAKTRTQFGQPIGAYQAVKHLLANVAVKTEFARPVLLRAAYALEQGLPSARVHVSHAKLATAEMAILAAETAIQVHGAMGYTYEVDLHFWMKRAWALAGAWGDRAFHLARLSDAVIGGLPIGPEHTFA